MKENEIEIGRKVEALRDFLPLHPVQKGTIGIIIQIESDGFTVKWDLKETLTPGKEERVPRLQTFGKYKEGGKYNEYADSLRVLEA